MEMVAVYAQRLKGLKVKLEAVALRHNVNPRIFFKLWLIGFLVKTVAFFLGITGILVVNHNIDLFFLYLNRLAAAPVPIYVIFWGRKLHWSIRPTYTVLFIVGTVGLERIFEAFK